MSLICPHCSQPIKVEIKLHDSKAFRSHRISIGIRASDKKIGRPERPLDIDRIVSLRNNGGTLRSIAKEMGTSARTILYRLKDLRLQGRIK